MEENDISLLQFVDDCLRSGFGHVAVVIDLSEAALDALAVVFRRNAASTMHDERQPCPDRDFLHAFKIQNRLILINAMCCTKAGRKCIDLGLLAELDSFIRICVDRSGRSKRPAFAGSSPSRLRRP